MDIEPTREQLDTFFDTLGDLLEDTGHEIIARFAVDGDAYVLGLYWRGRDWSEELTLYRVPQGTDMAKLVLAAQEAEEWDPELLELLKPWQLPWA